MNRRAFAGLSSLRPVSRLRGPMLLMAAVSLAVASAAVGQDRVPEGLSATDWSGIHAAYEANRHAVFAIDGGYQTHNPGQQWRTQFDGRGFLTTPDAGDWSWGLELVAYGRAGAARPVSSAAPANSRCGQRVEYDWNDDLTEWYVNDQRGLEHGYTVHQRASGAGPLHISLAVRGDLRPMVNRDGRGVTFINSSGSAIVNYGGLTVFDADGVELPAWFADALLPQASSLKPQAFQIIVDDRNACYPLTIDPIAQQAYLKASNTGASDQFGISVAVSGDTVVIGANGEDSNATGVNGNQADNSASNSGAAYVFVRSGGVWSQQAYLKASNTGAADNFGLLVDVSGDTVVVTAWLEDSNATGVNGNQADNSAADSGAAYVFVRSGTTWSQQAYLKASNTAAGDNFGYRLAASGDTVVIGAVGEDSNATGVNGNQTDNSAAASGAAYVFTRSGTTWSQQAYLKASNTGAGDSFGGSVAVWGDTVVVGAATEDSNATGVNGNQANNSASDSGAAYVFTRSGTIWSQQAYLKASNTEASDNFGNSVAVSGDTVVVGAYLEDSNATGMNGDQANNSASTAGAAYIFVRSGGVWNQQAYLKSSNTGAGDFFGYWVAVSGETVVVGALFEDSSATGVNGNQDDNSAADSGAAYVFTSSGTAWSQQAYLKALNTGATDWFGISVAVSGDLVVVGALKEASNATGVDGNQDDNSAADSGAAYVFLLPPDCDGDSVSEEIDNCPLSANAGQEDADNDGAGDACDVCPNTPAGLAADSTGRPHRDCNLDCLVDGNDLQCITAELLAP